MKVNISVREYQALTRAICDWESNCETADDDYIKMIKPDIQAVRRLIKKCQEKAKEVK